ncbi:MAG TPA: hypothetical protein VLS93_01670 [Anaeromyxobacteraceae bacterium]|nr:hypothetical protein [Anaeromyxobacteraceae bacterium]
MRGDQGRQGRLEARVGRPALYRGDGVDHPDDLEAGRARPLEQPLVGNDHAQSVQVVELDAGHRGRERLHPADHVVVERALVRVAHGAQEREHRRRVLLVEEPRPREAEERGALARRRRRTRRGAADDDGEDGHDAMRRIHGFPLRPARASRSS